MIRTTAAILAFASLSALSACGAGGSDFVAQTTAQCVKDEGQANAAKCACQAALFDKELNDKEKKAILLGLNQPEGATPEDGMKALEAAGLTMGDVMAMGMKMMPIVARAETECAK